MKPAPFKYHAPATVDEALALLAKYGYDGKVLAGGQSLIPMMNFRLAQPGALVDLNNVAELFFIQPNRDGGVRIGAMTRARQVEQDPLIAEAAPMVHAAMPMIAYPQIRTRGTFGGCLAHADPSAELPAVSVALKARMRVRGLRAERWVTADQFFQGFFATVLKPDELLVEIALPPMPRNSGWSFMEVARRHHDFALVGVAAVVTLNEAKNLCQEARAVFFSVGEGPVQAHHAVQVLQGQAPTAEAIREAAEVAARDDVDPTTDINASADYRRHLVGVLGRRALTEAFDRARKG